ncbi:MAG TPA: hypothetical protein VN655_08760 [Pseudolabrys sp.]|jgi:hypothetical protein|nr:hypothetical protein [Pseudolabrys sp.]
MRLIGGLLVTLVLAAPSFAQDGCGKFAWPLAQERQRLAATPTMDAKAGDALSGLPRTALVLHLAAANDATFTLPPERKPKAATWFGGALSLPAPAKAGIYQVTLSEEAWIDLVQDGRYAHSVGSTGRSDCPGVRKSVRFELNASPFVLQVSGVTSEKIALTIAPVQ